MSAADRHAWTEPGVEDLDGGVYRIPLPLPMDGLKAVNVYAITDPGGVDLIDAGIALVPARERLTAALRQVGYELGDIRNFFVTHIHIDHYSLAIELRKSFRSLVSLGEEERANLDATREMVNGSPNRFFGIEGLLRLGAKELINELSAQNHHPPGYGRLGGPGPLADRRDRPGPADPDAPRGAHPRSHPRPSRLPRRHGQDHVRG